MPRNEGSMTKMNKLGTLSALQETPTKMSLISRKVCLIGDFGVGKTSLIRRFVDRQFSDQYLSTVGVKISRKTVAVSHGHSSEPTPLQLLIWDIEGAHAFKSAAQSYLQGAKAALIVGDASASETLDHIPDHIQRFLSLNPQAVVAIAFNKVDLIDPELQEKLLYRFSFPNSAQVRGVYLTSAKTGSNVDVIFQTLSDQLI
jgi:small GTP-binding protein